jgi:hypothetical protein
MVWRVAVPGLRKGFGCVAVVAVCARDVNSVRPILMFMDRGA